MSLLAKLSKLELTRCRMVAELQGILQSADGPTKKITMQMKLLWISGHAYKHYMLVTLHLVDAESPEPVEDQLAVNNLARMKLGL